MTAREAWRVLGLDPTRDVGAIRRAYAAALKAIDPDADPDRFNALRDARDTALNHARTPVEEPDEQDYGWVEEAVMSGDDSRFDTVADYPDPAPAVRIDPHEAAIGAHYGSLLTLLFPDGAASTVAPTPDEAERMREHFAALLDDPRLDHIEFRAGAEDELARLLAAALPRSDALVELAIQRFGWDAARGRVDQPQPIAGLVDRFHALAYRKAVMTPGHPLRRAWRAVAFRERESDRSTLFASKKKVRQLIAEIRELHPMLEDRIDWYRVSLYERPSITWYQAALLVLAPIYLAFRVFLFFDGNSSSPPPSRPQPVAWTRYADPSPIDNRLRSADADLGDAVALATDSRVTLPVLSARRPALVKELRLRWVKARADDVDRAPFVTSVARELRLGAAAGQRVASYDLAAEFARAQLEMLQRLGMRGLTVEMCGDTAGKQPVPAALLGDDLVARQNALLARALIETDAAPETGTRLFRVPGPVVTAAAARARVPRADFTAAMRGGGTADTRCRTRIALLEEALSLPRAQALPLLRQL